MGPTLGLGVRIPGFYVKELALDVEASLRHCAEATAQDGLVRTKPEGCVLDLGNSLVRHFFRFAHPKMLSLSTPYLVLWKGAYSTYTLIHLRIGIAPSVICFLTRVSLDR